MVLEEETHQMTYVVEILSRTEETLAKLHHYYKFGRHSGVLLDELYSWLAHGAHLVFSLLLADEAGLSGTIEGNPHLASLVAGLDFTPFHYLDYRRRVFYWSAYQEYLKAEPRWFSLWVKILEKSERLSVSDLAEFYRLMLTRVGHGGPTDRKMSRKNDVALMRLLQTSPGGRIIVSSMRVLEDMVSALISCVARADPTTYAPVQIQSLAHLLGQVRHTIVWDGAAEGPYAPQRNRAWGVPSTFAPLCFWRAPGLLRITPKDEGGEVTCTYTWNGRSKTWHRSWTRSTAALRQEYEGSLFGTWSYDGGECLHGTGDCARMKACWVIADPEATHLESVCRQADAILEKLATYPAYGPLVEEVACMVRADESTWGPRNLAWTHIRDLDQLVCKLECVCQETQSVDGAQAEEMAVAQLRSTGQGTVEGGEMNNAPRHGSEDGEAYGASVSHLVSQRPETEWVQKTVRELPTDGQQQGYEPDTYYGQANRTGLHHERVHETLKRQDMDIQSNQNLVGESRTLDLGQELRVDTCRDPKGSTESHDEITAREPISTTPKSDSGDPLTEQGVTHNDGQNSGPGDTVAKAEPEARKPVHRSRVVESAQGQAAGERDSRCLNGEDKSLELEPQDRAKSGRARIQGKPEEIGSHAHSASGVPEPADPTANKQSYGRSNPVEQTPGSPGAVNVSNSDRQTPARPRKRTARVKNDTASETDPRETGLLVRRLAEHHQESNDGANHRPLSSKQLQQELQWGQSKVRRAMAHVFGEKPFLRYREKCRNDTILVFLLHLGGNERARHVHAGPLHTGGVPEDRNRHEVCGCARLPMRRRHRRPL